MQVDYITHYGTDLSVVNAARVSFDQESDWEYGFKEEYHEELGGDVKIPYPVLSERDTKLIHYLAKHKHTSTFEHQGATLRLKAPLPIARQIQRHRTFSYNEVSRRYVDSTPEFFRPDGWRKAAENVKQGSSDELAGKLFWRAADNWYPIEERVEEHIKESVELYEDMLKGGVAPELARMILPQNMYTEFYMTGNLRNWAHFLKLRLDGHAQKEVQDVAKMVESTLKPLWPVSVEALMQYE